MKIAVHVHLFYIEMYDEIKKYLDNLSFHKFDIFFTVPEKNFGLKLKIKKDFYNFNVHIIETENVGFDIYPFLIFLNTIDLDNYDLIVKLHSKQNIAFEHYLNGYNVYDHAFRSYLFTAILGTRERVEEILNIFRTKNDVGMIGSQELIIQDEATEEYIDLEKVKIVLQDCNHQMVRKEFIAGTIFIARACLFKSVKNKKYTIKDFPPYYPQDWNSLPYCLERYFGFMVSSQGYKLLGLPTTGIKSRVLENHSFMKKILMLKKINKLLFGWGT